MIVFSHIYTIYCILCIKKPWVSTLKKIIKKELSKKYIAKNYFCTKITCISNIMNKYNDSHKQIQSGLFKCKLFCCLTLIRQSFLGNCGEMLTFPLKYQSFLSSEHSERRITLMLKRQLMYLFCLSSPSLASFPWSPRSLCVGAACKAWGVFLPVWYVNYG